MRMNELEIIQMECIRIFEEMFLTTSFKFKLKNSNPHHENIK
jgi:hypothetical protein